MRICSFHSARLCLVFFPCFRRKSGSRSSSPRSPLRDHHLPALWAPPGCEALPLVRCVFHCRVLAAPECMAGVALQLNVDSCLPPCISRVTVPPHPMNCHDWAESALPVMWLAVPTLSAAGRALRLWHRA